MGIFRAGLPSGFLLACLAIAGPARADAPLLAASKVEAAPTPVEASAFTTLDLKFGLYALGGQAFDVDFSLVRNGRGLEMVQGMRSTGATNLVLRLRMTGRMQAEIDAPGALRPLVYVNNSDGSFSKRSVQMRWDDRGLPLAVVDPPADADDRDPVPEALIRGTLDPTTAALTRLMRPGAEPPCDGTERIFDGRRRYDLHFSPVQWENVFPTSRSAFAGAAFRCQMKVQPIAGYARKYLAESRKMEQDVTDVWLSYQPKRDIWLPVRMRSSWTFGDVIGHISAAAADGEDLVPPLTGLDWPRARSAAR